MCDVDHFKAYNDILGHVAGDACLREIAAILRAHARRAGDVVARYGGEEFAVIMPRCSLPEAQAISASILDAIRDNQIAHAGSQTASCAP
jgi:diguanylate cyclase (GGDEF)-like protein